MLGSIVEQAALNFLLAQIDFVLLIHFSFTFLWLFCCVKKRPKVPHFYRSSLHDLANWLHKEIEYYIEEMIKKTWGMKIFIISAVLSIKLLTELKPMEKL